ncbi:MAG: hypothetical protein IIA45_11655 [Bacteroidetes bacterium]|nr:hypothetical protein [Bacteroidota bacterium]
MLKSMDPVCIVEMSDDTLKSEKNLKFRSNFESLIGDFDKTNNIAEKVYEHVLRKLTEKKYDF